MYWTFPIWKQVVPEQSILRSLVSEVLNLMSCNKPIDDTIIFICLKPRLDKTSNWWLNVQCFLSRLSQIQILFLGPLEWRNIFTPKTKFLVVKSWSSELVSVFVFVCFNPFYLTWIYKKGNRGNFIFQPSTLLPNKFEANIQKLEGYIFSYIQNPFHTVWHTSASPGKFLIFFVISYGHYRPSSDFWLIFSMEFF